MLENGIGIDIVEVSRIEKIYNKFGHKFLNKIFNDFEIDYIKEKNYRVETIAGMFSFKEAISKALATGIGRNLRFKDIEVYHTNEGMPYGKAKGRNFLLSLSHDGNLAVTFASLQGKIMEISEIIKKLYRTRSDKSHKGTFGKTMVIAGSEGMVGAGYLSSYASLKAGSGLTYHYVFEEDNIFLPLSVKHTEVILRQENPFKDLKKMDAILYGPGLGITRKKREVLNKLLREDINLIIDADGINMLSESLLGLITKKARVILTPHILEFSRLLGGEITPPGEKLYRKAKDFAKDYNLVLVLKDSKTFVTNGVDSHLLERENSGLATAGSGDVLAGIITSLVAQGYNLYEGAILGVEIHSLAGNLAANKKSKTSLLASDIIEALDEVYRELEVGFN